MLEIILGFVIAIFILVFVHELGHFLMAKITGCRVDEFAVGFKPALWQKMYRGTNYVLGSIPIGGYVKIWGENGSEDIQDDPGNPQAFYNRPRLYQAIVLFGGVLFNFILAWLCFSLLLTRGLEVSETQFPNHGLDNAQVQIVGLVDGYPASETGLQVGDVVVSVINSESGETMRVHPKDGHWVQVRDFINAHPGEIILSIDRPSSESQISQPESMYISTVMHEGRNVIGVQLDNIGTIELPFGQAVYHGARMTWDFSVTIVWFLGNFFADLFVGEADTDNVAGPVGIASFAGDSFSAGFDDFVWFIAVLSLNLAIFNLLPIPALDGGRLVFVAIESVIRRPLDPKWFYRINAAGFIFLIGLMLVVTVFDISRMFS